MPNKKYLPNLGFIILFITLLSSALFVKWVLDPFSYERAAYEEQRGHQLAKEGKGKQASKHFLTAAQIEDNNLSTSRRYRCAGTTSSNTEDKIKYFELALKYNPNNENAKNELKLLLNTITEVGN